MPMLAPTSSVSSSTVHGCCTHAEQPRGELLERLGIVASCTPAGPRTRRRRAARRGRRARRSSASRGPELAQQHVAVVVAERVVDLLEAVEVHQHHARTPCRLGLRGIDLLARAARRKRSRLARPVSSSVVAIRCSSSPRCLDFSSSPTRYWKTTRTSANSASPIVPSCDREVHGGHRQQRREQLGRKHRGEHLAGSCARATAVEIALIAGDVDEVQRQRQHEGDEHRAGSSRRHWGRGG